MVMIKVFQMVGNYGYEIGVVEDDKQFQELIEQLDLYEELENGYILTSQIDD